MLGFVLTALWLGVAGTALLSGLDFYLLSGQERAFSPLADLWSPTGLYGQGMGIVGSAMILVGVLGYSARKRFALLARVGQLRHWLSVHIFLCTLGPFLVLLHTTFKFGGIVSIAFWSMAIVVASGVFGRYVYARIPKSVNGRFLGLRAIQERALELSAQIAARTGLPRTEIDGLVAAPVPSTQAESLIGSLGAAFASDLRAMGQRRALRAFLKRRAVPLELHAPVVAMDAERRRLLRQALLLQPCQRLFRYWHVIHLPLATVMFIVLAIHVTVAVMFGYTWIFS
jgi:hypothetical protein